MKKKGKKIITLLMVFIALLFLGFKPKKQKLLIYITTENGETELYFKDTDSIPNICVKLHIDTIDIDNIRMKCNNGLFFYNNIDAALSKHQLFNLKDYNKLKKYHISLGIQNPVIDGHTCEGLCTGDKRSRFIIATTKRLAKKINKRVIFWLSGFAITDNPSNPQFDLNRINVIVYPSNSASYKSKSTSGTQAKN